MTADQNWRLSGEYLENCNCEVLCPCLLPGVQQDPTEGHCDMTFAFHIEEGEFDGVNLNDLNFVAVLYTPGKMSNPDLTMALYVDDLASMRQRASLGRILSEKTGGPVERWMSMTSNYLGIKYVPIDFRIDGNLRSVSIPQVMEWGVEGILQGKQTEAMRLENWRPRAPSMVMAKGTKNTYVDHGMNWDNTSKNGHYAPFQWP